MSDAFASPDIKANIAAIRSIANEACEAAYEAYLAQPDRNRGDTFGAVNWGDIGCADILFCIGDDDEYYEVILEEADPSAVGLHIFVRDYLKDRGWPGVSVRTEW